MRHPRTLREIVEHGLCIGCGLCQSVAGPDRVQMRWVDPPGRLRPAQLAALDEATERRILDTCPGALLDQAVEAGRHDGAAVDACFGPWIRAWKGHASDPEIHHRGSSGGTLTALGIIGSYLVRVLRRGGPDCVVHLRHTAGDGR